MTKIDDLNSGDYICVCGDRVVEEAPLHVKLQIDYSGEPFELIHVELPFLCVRSTRNKRTTIDVRRFLVQKVSEEYFRNHLEVDYENTKGKKITPLVPYKYYSERILCPNCSANLQRSDEVKDYKKMKKYLCCECGFVGVLVAKGYQDE